MGSQPVNSSVYSSRIERVLEHINLHLDEPLTLDRKSVV